MTLFVSKKEQAEKLREAASLMTSLNLINIEQVIARANDLDPPVKEDWEIIRNVYIRDFCINGFDESKKLWSAIIAEARKGYVSKEELTKMAPWHVGPSGNSFCPASYNDGIQTFLRVLNSL